MSNKIRYKTRSASSTEEEDLSDANSRINLNSSQNDRNSLHDGIEMRQRGRGPSKKPCLNRNAVMARENRLRKKAYLEKIENKLSFYQNENKNLATTVQKQSINIKRLTGEVTYLKSILNNNTAITALLKSINDGLKKLNNYSKKPLYSPNSAAQVRFKTEDPMTPEKHLIFSRRNILESENYNSLSPSINEALAEHNEEFFNRGCDSTKKHLNSKNRLSKKIQHLSTDSDHNYINSMHIATDSNYDIHGKSLDNSIENTLETDTSNSICEKANNDRINDKCKEELSNITSTSLLTSEESMDINSMNMDLNELAPFNINIFEDLSKCDEVLNSTEIYHDELENYNDEDLLQNLNNTGICLHINSDKVSLEYCSTCHMNNANSEIN